MDPLRQAPLLAKNLRLEVAALGAPVPLNEAQALNLAAQAHGHDNWDALVKVHRSRYFYARHLPYLPNKPELVRALSTRKAALEDLAAVEALTTASRGPWCGLNVLGVAIDRALRQARTMFEGEVTFSPGLLEAVAGGVTGDLVELWKVEAEAQEQLARCFSDASTADHWTAPFQALSTHTSAQQESYHAAYLRWRLSTLSVALCAVCDRREGVSLADMLRHWKREEVFVYVGALVLDQLGHLEHMDSATLLHTQNVGRTVFLNVQTNGSMEQSLCHLGSLALPDVSRLVSRLHERFPELTFWHAWVEVKPLLAEGIDTLIR